MSDKTPLPPPRTRDQQTTQQREYRKAHPLTRARVVQSELDAAREIAHIARQLGLRVPFERNHRCPDLEWVLGAAIQLGLPALRAHLDAHKLLPVRTEE